MFQQLKSGISAASVWDAVHLGAGELMMRQPGIYGIHTVTSTSAIRYAYETAAARSTRLLLLLQAVGWLCQFRRFMGKTSAGLSGVRIDQLAESQDVPNRLDTLFSLVSTDKVKAAREAMAVGTDETQTRRMMRRARHYIVHKATDAHDYKYATSIFDDVWRVTPRWRPQMLATAAQFLHGSATPTPALMRRIAERLRA